MSERLSHELNMEMIGILAGEFDVQGVTGRFAEGLQAGKDPEDLAKDVFGSYGRAWAGRTLELGEKYTDQTYENLKDLARRIKRLYFSHVPQRFVEIGYLATQPFETLAVRQNNNQAFIFEVPECGTYAALVEKCGEKVAAGLPCKYGCLAFNDAIYKGLNLAVDLEMTASMPANGFCRFVATNPDAGRE